MDGDDIFNCTLCTERFNLGGRKPKVLDCGHTFCLNCLNEHVKKNAKFCPTCRKVFETNPANVIDNFLLCPYLEGDEAEKALGRFQCLDCNKEASDLCMEHHAIRSLTSMILKQVQDAKQKAQEQFNREQNMLKEFLDDLETMRKAISDGLKACIAQDVSEYNERKKAVKKALKDINNLSGTVFQDRVGVDKVMHAFLSENNRRLASFEEQKRMLELAKKCTITVTSETSGVCWGTKVNLNSESPPAEKVLVYLLYGLLSNQHRQREATCQVDTAPCAPTAPLWELQGSGDAGQPSSQPSDLEQLIAQAQKCVVEGKSMPHSAVGNDDDDDDDISDGESVMSEATLPDTCRNNKKVFVGGIPQGTTVQELKDLFSRYGRVQYVRILTKGKATNPKQMLCALIYFPDDATVRNVLEASQKNPIMYQKQGEWSAWRLNVQEDREQNQQAKRQTKNRNRRKGSNPPQSSAPPCAGKGPSAKPGAGNSSDREEFPSAHRVFASNVPPEMTEIQLENLFVQYGKVISVRKRAHFGQKRFMGFITFVDSASAQRALKAAPIKFYGGVDPDGVDLLVRQYQSPSEAKVTPASSTKPAPLHRPPPPPPQKRQPLNSATSNKQPQPQPLYPSLPQQQGGNNPHPLKPSGNQGNVPKSSPIQSFNSTNLSRGGAKNDQGSQAPRPGSYLQSRVEQGLTYEQLQAQTRQVPTSRPNNMRNTKQQNDCCIS